ncbi:MAG: ATP-binding cassette domain-containing protein, partial [Saccharofermentanales bacterium]
MNNEVVIKCENISKTFPTADGSAFDVIADFSIEVNKNEFVALIGPGQCGKTTLINIIAGLEEATSGIVKVGGEPVTEPDPKIGVVYQETNLFPWLTVMGNVEFGPKAQGESKASRQE